MGETLSLLSTGRAVEVCSLEVAFGAGTARGSGDVEARPAPWPTASVTNPDAAGVWATFWLRAVLTELTAEETWSEAGLTAE